VQFARTVKTTIDIKSDSDYTEINEGRIGGIATREIIEARRVADCHPQAKRERQLLDLSVSRCIMEEQS